MIADTKQQGSIRHEQKDKNGTNHLLKIWISTNSSTCRLACSGSEESVCKSEGVRERMRKKKQPWMPTGETALALMMCHKAPNREKYLRFLLCEFQTHPQWLPLPDPSWPHRWTFEKQSLESVLSNGFIKEVIILQQGGAVNGRSNDVFHYPTLTKLLIQGLTEYLQFCFFQRGKEPFPPFLLPPSVSTEDLSALIKSEFCSSVLL